MQKVRRLGVMSLAKIFGLLYGIFGLILGALFTILAFAGLSVEQTGMFFGSSSIIMFPLVYGIMGFVSGLITAFFYNFIANKIGGIEVEIK